MPANRKKFATQVDRDVLVAIAKEERRQVRAIVEDALKAHIEQRGESQPP